MEQQLFNNFYKKDAQELLNKSRKEIDHIDNELINLISKRTSLAKDILLAKLALNMEIYDENREKLIHEKAQKLAKEKNIDENIIIQFMNILTNLSKDEQKKLLKKIEEEK